MKITKQALKRMIMEELTGLGEVDEKPSRHDLEVDKNGYGGGQEDRITNEEHFLKDGIVKMFKEILIRSEPSFENFKKIKEMVREIVMDLDTHEVGVQQGR